MQRRTFLQSAISAALLAGVRGTSWAQTRGTAPIFWVQLYVTGGWDQMLFCDPKAGMRGGPGGGHQNDSQIGKLGPVVRGITYVDAGNNTPDTVGPVKQFFTDFGSRLLVLNGLDATTNNHDVGTRYFSSGSLLEGFPIFAAQVAGVLGAGDVMPLVDISGYDETGGLVAPVRLDYQGTPQIRKLQDTNKPQGEYDDDTGSTVSAEHLLDPQALAAVRAARAARLDRLAAAHRLPGHQRGIASYKTALGVVPDLAKLAIPDSSNNVIVSYKALATMGISAFKAGLATSMLVTAGGPSIDNHGHPDTEHLDSLVEAFGVARHIADQADAADVPCIVVMSSDFGRTPVREGTGSGHWPISSMMVLQNAKVSSQNVLPAGITIGGTTGEPTGAANNPQTTLRPRKIHPKTHAFDDTGITLSPAHVYKALRRVAGIHDHSALSPFPIAVDGSELDFFS